MCNCHVESINPNRHSFQTVVVVDVIAIAADVVKVIVVVIPTNVVESEHDGGRAWLTHMQSVGANMIGLNLVAVVVKPNVVTIEVVIGLNGVAFVAGDLT